MNAPRRHYMISDDEQVQRLIDGIVGAQGYEQERIKSGVYASEIANCMRKVWYQIKGVEPGIPQSLSNKTRLIMSFGNLFEELITTQMQLLGVWRGKARTRHRVYPISGETDPIAQFEGKLIVFEAKATHRGSFYYKVKEFQQGICDEGYYSQLQTYLWLLPDIDFGVILVANRDMKPEDDLPPFIWKKVDRDIDWQKENIERLRALTAAIDDNWLPEREFTLNEWQCQKCPFQDRCWNADPKGGPESKIVNGGVGEPDRESKGVPSA